MSNAFSNPNLSDNDDKQNEETYIMAPELSSGEEEPMSEWESLESGSILENMKRNLYTKGFYTPENREVCMDYIRQSDSTILCHEYYNYPAVNDPGIKEALLKPEPAIIYPIDGQKLYLDLCSEMNVSVVKLFYNNLLRSDIDLSYYGVHQKGFQAMAIALHNNDTVIRFNLTDNFLDSDACYHLGEMLTTNNTIQEFILSGCRIGASGLSLLGHYLHFNRSLILLDLSRNKLRNEGGLFFTNLIAKGFPIKKVNLSYNELGHEFALGVASDMDIRNPLTHLDLSWNTFNNVSSTVKMLQTLSLGARLQVINLSFNALEGERVAAGIFTLLSIPGLSVLDLSNNRLQGQAINIITRGLFKAKRLKTLNLSFNPITCSDAYGILENMLNPRVKLLNLLLEKVCVEKHFLELLEVVLKMKNRKKFTVVHGEVMRNWTLKGYDPRELILKRANYLGGNNVDIILYFLKLGNEYEIPIPTTTLTQLVKDDKINLDEGFIEELACTFPGGKHTVDFQKVSEYIGRLWPDKKAAMSPPPEPIPTE